MLQSVSPLTTTYDCGDGAAGATGATDTGASEAGAADAEAAGAETAEADTAAAPAGSFSDWPATRKLMSSRLLSLANRLASTPASAAICDSVSPGPTTWTVAPTGSAPAASGANSNLSAVAAAATLLRVRRGMSAESSPSQLAYRPGAASQRRHGWLYLSWPCQPQPRCS